MLGFWPIVVKPLLDDVAPEVVVDVGPSPGRMLKNLLGWAEGRETVVHAIDSAPSFNVDALTAAHGSRLVLHRAEGHEALSRIDTPDVVLLGSARNWWTVHEQLGALRAGSRRTGRPFPLTLVTNVSWPYGRRDHYGAQDPAPEAHRHPARHAGLVPGRRELSATEGINGGTMNAEAEGTPRNGVLTAVEDFMSETPGELALAHAHGFAGLALLVESRRLQDPSVRQAFERLTDPTFLLAHTKRLEDNVLRMQLLVANGRRQQRDDARTITQLRAGTAAQVDTATAAAPAIPAAVTASATPAAATDPPSSVPGGGTAPRVDELRVALVAGPRERHGFGRSCHVTPLTPDSWRAEVAAGPVDVVLVVTEPSGPWDGLGALLAHCTAHALPTVLWATLPAGMLAAWQPAIEVVDHVFVADRAAAEPLAKSTRSGAVPGVLAPAVHLDLHRPAAQPRPSAVHIGGWPAPPVGTTPDERLLQVIAGEAAASPGLEFLIAPGDTEPPEALGASVHRVGGYLDAAEALRRHAVVLAFGPGTVARALAPVVALEAVACGVVPLAPPNAAVRHLVDDAVVQVRTAEQARAALDELLADPAAARARAEAGRRKLELSHTYEHRLATIASVLGLRLVP